ncbi:hypothetical protein [uncultured Gammaproteobacteria bacterium]|nr:hypothetical protein [uncultured Gammaproteobacteria bacterium]
MGTGYFFYNFFSYLNLPWTFKVDNKPYFCATVTTQFFTTNWRLFINTISNFI